MRKIYFLFVFIISLFSEFLQAQNLSSPDEHFGVEALHTRTGFEGRNIWILRGLSTAQIETVCKEGAQIQDMLAPDEMIFSFPENFDPGILKEMNIEYLYPVNPKDKIAQGLSRQLEVGNISASHSLVISLSVYPGYNEENVLSALQDARCSRIHVKSYPAHIQCLINTTDLNRIASLPFVRSLGKEYKGKALARQNRQNARVELLNLPVSTGGYNLSGNGVVVGVGDVGTIDEHFETDVQILNEDTVDGVGHGALVSGIIASNGKMHTVSKGMAPNTSIIADYFNLVIDHTPDYVSNFGMTLTNNSYGDDFSCFDFGEYTVSSQQGDDQIYNNNQLNHVFASGNSGTMTCLPYPAGYGTILNAFQSSKNTLVVGSVSQLDVISGFSCKGPTQDGRLKPEIMAVGESVFSSHLLNDYVNGGSGTSYSCPTITGILSLMTEHYKNLNATNPRGDVLKAIICNTADDIGNPGPDYASGFGRVNARKAVKNISDVRYGTGTVNNAGVFTQNITVPAGSQYLKVLLYWNDPSASLVAPVKLVNNLNLQVITPSASTILPLVLDPTPANVTNNATNGVDNLNNIEQVVIPTPSAGTYQIRVLGTAVPVGPQSFAFSYEYEPAYVRLTSMLGGDSYFNGENVVVTWDAAGNEANNFTLEYSINNGSTWSTVSSTIPGGDRYYSLNLPAAVTDEALIRISRNGTALTDQSDTTFTIIGVVSQSSINVTSTCSGGANLTWNAATGATSYNIYSCTGPCVLAGNTSSTSFSFTGLTQGEHYVFVVEPVGPGGEIGRRSPSDLHIATNIAMPLVSTYPYLEGFELSTGGWYSSGKQNSWQWATPANTEISRAAEGSKAFVTNPTGNYPNASRAYLYSPCFDLSSLTNPQLSLGLSYMIENDTAGSGEFDYVRMEYSVNGGNWTVLGANNDPNGLNWNTHVGSSKAFWDSTRSFWHNAGIPIPTTASQVQFRMLMNSDGFVNYEGVAVDNIHIYDKKDIYPGPVNTSLSQAVSGSNWIDFLNGGDYMISLNPNGQNLGNTLAEVFINTSGIRNDGMQYYLDRNWVVTPTNMPANPVGVRLYFLDSEAESLRLASGCGVCTGITDAFAPGVTKYTGVNENGDLNDNTPGPGFSFILPADAEFVPFGKGYYVEFQTTGFSEFWINGGGPNQNAPLPVDLKTFRVEKSGMDAVVTWEYENEENVDHYAIQVAKGLDGLLQNAFETLGQVQARNNGSGSYTYVDNTSNKSGDRYYRLQILDKDAKISFSETKKLNFDKEKERDIYVFPNPAKNIVQVRFEEPKGQYEIQLLDLQGKLIRGQKGSWNSAGETIGMKLEDIARGSYFIKIFYANSTYIEKLLIH